MSANNHKFNHPVKEKEAKSFREYAERVARDYRDDKAYKNNHEDLIKNLVKNLMEGFYDAGMFRNCLNCDNWISTGEKCSLVNKHPPAKVIVTGCEMHTAIIPF